MIDKTHGLHQVSDKAKPPSGEGAKGSNPPEPCVQIKPLLKRMREGVYNPLPPPGPFEGRGVFGKTAGQTIQQAKALLHFAPPQPPPSDVIRPPSKRPITTRRSRG